MSAAASGGATAAAPPRVSWIVAAGNFLFHWRNLLFPLVFLAVAAASRPLAPFGDERLDLWMDAIGLAIALSGQAVRVAVIGLAYIIRGGKEGRIHAEDLVVDGFFAHSRNPLYLGNMLIFAGLLVVLNSPAGWLVGAPFYLFAYWALTLAEENFLRGRFGAAYDDYTRRVRNRFWPKLAGLGATMRSMEFNWRRVVRKEYGSTFSWFTTFLALLVWERAARGGSAAAMRALPGVGLAWAAAIGGYATARTLKKKGRL